MWRVSDGPNGLDKGADRGFYSSCLVLIPVSLPFFFLFFSLSSDLDTLSLNPGNCIASRDLEKKKREVQLCRGKGSRVTPSEGGLRSFPWREGMGRRREGLDFGKRRDTVAREWKRAGAEQRQSQRQRKPEKGKDQGQGKGQGKSREGTENDGKPEAGIGCFRRNALSEK